MFRAYDPERERLVAVKLFRLDLVPERVHQLVSEFEQLIAADLTHPSLVVPLSTGIAGVTAYLAEDYVAAKSLDVVLRERGAHLPSEVLRMAADLAAGLDAATVLGVAHGALHPRDVLLSDDQARVTGVGIARALHRVGVPVPVRRPYTAPERMAGADGDHRADVFGLAALVHELLWARRVTGWGDEAVAALSAIEGTDLPRLRAVFGRALAEDPDRRFQTATEFVSALTDACSKMTMGRSTEDSKLREAARPAIGAPRLPLEVQVDEAAERPLLPPLALRLGPTELIAADGPEPFDRLNRPGDPRPDIDLAMPRRGPEGSAVVGLAIEPAEIPMHPRAVHDTAARDIAVPRLDAALPLVPTPKADEPSRSRISPLAFALLVGAAVGFAAGYGVGATDRLTAAGQKVAVALPAAGPSTPAPTDVVTPTSSAATTASRVPPPTPVGETARVETLRPVPRTPDTVAPLAIRSRPVGAKVFVDGREYGRTPVTVRDLTRGAHRVRLVSDGFKTEEKSIVVGSPDAASSLDVRLSPARPVAPVVVSRPAPPKPAPTGPTTLVVESRPAGANVFVDGRLVGKTPLSLPRVAAGDHDVRLEHDGYKRWLSSVHVAAGESNRATASLER